MSEEEFLKQFIKNNPFDFKQGIINHCRQLDKSDVYEWVAEDELKIQRLQQENEQLKEQLKEEQEEYNRMFGLWHNRKFIKKFDDEYDAEDKKKNPNRTYAGIIPDAEEVYKRYYGQKSVLDEIRKIIQTEKRLMGYATYDSCLLSIEEQLDKVK